MGGGGTASVPVICNRAPFPDEDGYRWDRTQYRRLEDGSWLADDLTKYGDEHSLLRAGDVWIDQPNEGTLEREQAESLIKPLQDAISTPNSCWFGVYG